MKTKEPKVFLGGAPAYPKDKRLIKDNEAIVQGIINYGLIREAKASIELDEGTHTFEDFNLSERIQTAWITKKDTKIVCVEDVKEFIERIKMTMLFTPSPKERGKYIQWLANEIDKLAGEKLKCGMSEFCKTPEYAPQSLRDYYCNKDYELCVKRNYLKNLNKNLNKNTGGNKNV